MRLKRSGFSLVLSLTIMAAMVMLVIVLASFLQVESRLAQSHAGYLRARFNALASARIAIGQLQATMGPDQRVSMRADMFSAEVPSPSGDTAPAAANNPNKPAGGTVAHQKRYWTGVWSTGGADTSKPRDWNVADPHDSRLFLGWLTSPTAVNTGDPELVNPSVASLNYYLPNRNNFGADGKAIGDGQILINALGTPLASDFVRLVGGSSAANGQTSAGSIQWPTSATTPSQQRFYGAIDLPAMPLPGPSVAGGGGFGVNGRFAYWIGDEGIKAKVNLPDVHAVSNTGTSLPGLTEWDRGFAGTAAQRSSFESVRPSLNATAALMPANFDSNYLDLRNLDIVATIGNPLATWKDLGLARTRSRSEINAWAKNLGNDAAGNAITTANRLLWHEITPWSFSVLSDTLNGGVKTDLSTAFELPYSVFRTLEVFPGQKESTSAANNRKQSFFHGAPNATFLAGFASDLDYNRPNLMDKLGSPSEVLRASPRSPEWAPRYLSQIGSIGTLIATVRARNGGETPERLGFAYEVPLSSRFFNQTRINANVQSGAANAPSDVFTWPNLSETHPDNWTARIVRGPTWDLYRNHYRMYKREIEAAAANSGALRGQGAPADALGYVARGLEPLTYATGLRNHPERMEEPVANDEYEPPRNPRPDNFFSDGSVPNNYHYRNNLADGGVGPDFLAQRRYRSPFTTAYRHTPTSVFTGSSPRKTTGFLNYTAAGVGTPSPLTNPTAQDTRQTSARTWPTSPVLAPTILRFSTVYSALWQGNALGMTINPILVIHNPYDVALEFEGLAMVTNGASNPFRFVLRVRKDYLSSEYLYTQAPWDPAPRKPTDLPDGNLYRNATIDFGDIILGGGENDNRSTSFRIVAGAGGTTGGGGNVIRLEPGEIRVFGAAPSAGGLVNSSNTNVSIPGSIGYTIEIKAFYKMTPFHNVRARQGSGTRSAERVLWTMDYNDCTLYANYPLNPPVEGKSVITYTDGPSGRIGLQDKEYARRLFDLWEAAQAQRRIHDALPGWDGSAESLSSAVGGRSIEVIPRNSGWLNFNGFVVGAEREILTINPGPDAIPNTPDDPAPNYQVTNTGQYVAPVKRNGKVSLVGNQCWNFYLIGKNSIDGNKPLNPHRRWFGTPDERADSFIEIAASDGTTRKIRKYAEGTETVRGFNCVDESLLLNFQAMTGGWPMYSNSNNDSAYHTVPDYLARTGGMTLKPDYRLEGSTGLTTIRGTSLDPFQKDPEFNDIEPTAAKADTLFRAEEIVLNPGSSNTPVLSLDFVLRAADMTGNTDLWYPKGNASATANFGIKPGAPTSGYGQNFVLQTPEEMRNAPMTPYFLSYRAQQAQLFGYDGKAHTPVGWIQTQRSYGKDPLMTSDIFPTTADGRAFWGPSIDDARGGKSNVILYSVPRRPLLSLSQLGTVAFAEKSTDADFTVGSSFAHPGIGDLTRIVEWPGPRDLFPSEASLPSDVKGPVPELGYVAKHMGSLVLRNRTDIRTDHAFAANLTLWDSYYFSGLNLQANSFSHRDGIQNPWPNSGADLPIDAGVRTAQAAALAAAGLTNPTRFDEYKVQLNAGQALLANRRMKYLPDGKPSFTTNADYNNSLELPESEFPHPKYLARNSLYDGGFNVNSTSRAAWKAVLAGLRGQALPDATNPKPDGTALTKFARAFGQPADKTGNDPWTSYRELNDKQIDDLAGAVVEEIRNRGPFMSLADFVNRRLINDDNFGLKGALQAAIDKTTINDTAIAAAGGTFQAPPSTIMDDPNNHLFGNLLTSNGNWWTQRSAYPQIPANQRFPSLKAMSKNASSSAVMAGLGAPGIVTQMDVLNSIGPNLTARSDTFVVRAYGEALDDAGNVIGKAWVEVVVQRTTEYVAMAVGQKYPDFVEPNRRRLAYRVNSSGGREYDRQVLPEMYEVSPPPNPPGSSALERTALLQEQRINRILGRRFRPTALRWLAANEI